MSASNKNNSTNNNTDNNQTNNNHTNNNQQVEKITFNHKKTAKDFYTDGIHVDGGIKATDSSTVNIYYFINKATKDIQKAQPKLTGYPPETKALVVPETQECKDYLKILGLPPDQNITADKIKQTALDLKNKISTNNNRSDTDKQLDILNITKAVNFLFNEKNKCIKPALPKDLANKYQEEQEEQQNKNNKNNKNNRNNRNNKQNNYPRNRNNNRNRGSPETNRNGNRNRQEPEADARTGTGTGTNSTPILPSETGQQQQPIGQQQQQPIGQQQPMGQTPMNTTGTGLGSPGNNAMATMPMAMAMMNAMGRGPGSGMGGPMTPGAGMPFMPGMGMPMMPGMGGMMPGMTPGMTPGMGIGGLGTPGIESLMPLLMGSLANANIPKDNIDFIAERGFTYNAIKEALDKNLINEAQKDTITKTISDQVDNYIQKNPELKPENNPVKAMENIKTGGFSEETIENAKKNNIINEEIYEKTIKTYKTIEENYEKHIENFPNNKIKQKKAEEMKAEEKITEEKKADEKITEEKAPEEEMKADEMKESVEEGTNCQKLAELFNFNSKPSKYQFYKRYAELMNNAKSANEEARLNRIYELFMTKCNADYDKLKTCDELFNEFGASDQLDYRNKYGQIPNNELKLKTLGPLHDQILNQKCLETKKGEHRAEIKVVSGSNSYILNRYKTALDNIKIGIQSSCKVLKIIEYFNSESQTKYNEINKLIQEQENIKISNKKQVDELSNQIKSQIDKIGNLKNKQQQLKLDLDNQQDPTKKQSIENEIKKLDTEIDPINKDIDELKQKLADLEKNQINPDGTIQNYKSIQKLLDTLSTGITRTIPLINKTLTENATEDDINNTTHNIGEIKKIIIELNNLNVDFGINIDDNDINQIKNLVNAYKNENETKNEINPDERETIQRQCISSAIDLDLESIKKGLNQEKESEKIAEKAQIIAQKATEIADVVKGEEEKIKEEEKKEIIKKMEEEKQKETEFPPKPEDKNFPCLEIYWKLIKEISDKATNSSEQKIKLIQIYEKIKIAFKSNDLNEKSNIIGKYSFFSGYPTDSIMRMINDLGQTLGEREEYNKLIAIIGRLSMAYEKLASLKVAEARRPEIMEVFIPIFEDLIECIACINDKQGDVYLSFLKNLIQAEKTAKGGYGGDIYSIATTSGPVLRQNIDAFIGNVDKMIEIAKESNCNIIIELLSALKDFITSNKPPEVLKGAFFRLKRMDQNMLNQVHKQLSEAQQGSGKSNKGKNIKYEKEKDYEHVGGGKQRDYEKYEKDEEDDLDRYRHKRFDPTTIRKDLDSPKVHKILDSDNVRDDIEREKEERIYKYKIFKLKRNRNEDRNNSSNGFNFRHRHLSPRRNISNNLKPLENTKLNNDY